MDTNTNAFFVSTTGNDYGTGSIDDPFASLDKALSTVGYTNGGTIYLREGTYYQTEAEWLGSGTADNHLTISAYNGEKVTLDGSYYGDSAFYAVGSQYVDINGLELQNFGGHGMEVIAGDNINITNNKIHNTVGMGLRVRGNLVEVEGSDFDKATNILVDGNEIYNTQTYNSGANKGNVLWGMAMNVMNVENVTVTNNQVYKNYGEGIGLELAQNCTVANNTLYDNFSVQMYIDNTIDSKFNGNFIYNTGDAEFLRNGYQSNGIQLANETYKVTGDPSRYYVNRVEITNNIVVGGSQSFYYGTYPGWGNEGTNYHSMKNTLIANNTFVNPNINLVQVDYDPGIENIQFINNIFSDNDGSGVDLGGSGGISFNNNLLSGNVNAGAAGGGTNIYGDAMLVGAGSFNVEDYQIQQGSAAIDAGQDLSQVTSDRFGTSRPVNGKLDIGADEFGSGSTPVETPAPVVEETPAPVVEEPAPVVEEPAPVVEETPAPVVEETPAPVVEEPAPVVIETPAPIGNGLESGLGDGLAVIDEKPFHGFIWKFCHHQ
jgi:parallel beta-helix repeat protein